MNNRCSPPARTFFDLTRRRFVSTHVAHVHKSTFSLKHRPQFDAKEIELSGVTFQIAFVRKFNDPPLFTFRTATTTTPGSQRTTSGSVSTAGDSRVL